MIIKTNKGLYDTSKVYEELNKNMVKLEETMRTVPTLASDVVVGHIIPLVTLGGAISDEEQFSSNFQIIAYNCPNILANNYKDLEDFNVTKSDISYLVKNIKTEFSKLANQYFGEGWNITIFNAKIETALNSMTKGMSSPEQLVNQTAKMIEITKGRLDNMDRIFKPLNTKDDNKDIGDIPEYQHNIIHLFYGWHKALSIKVKQLDRKTDSSNKTDDIEVKILIYDRWANGLRVLINNESFTSTRIRMYNGEDEILGFSLKARLAEDDSNVMPIREFDGTTKLTPNTIKSGCTRRIIYNIINKNYEHWSYLSIPSNIKIDID